MLLPSKKQSACPSAACCHVEVILVTRLQFLDNADPEWAHEHVLPLLDFEAVPAADSQTDGEPRGVRVRRCGSSHSERVWRCWSAYLTWGKTTNRLLEAGQDRMYLDITRRIQAGQPDLRPGTATGQPDLRPEASAAIPHDLQAPDRSIDRLPTHLAGICAYSDQLIRDPGWILDITSALPDEGRLRFIRAIGSTLSELDTEAVDETWNRWLKPYWQHRLDGVPDRLGVAEAGAFAELTPYLKSHASNAIRMSLQAPACLFANGFLPFDSLPSRLFESQLPEEIPTEVAQLLLHLCTHTEPATANAEQVRFLISDPLSELISRLRGCSDNALIESIIDQTMRLGLSYEQAL